MEQVFVNENNDLAYFVPMFQTWYTGYEVLRDLVIKRFDFAVQNLTTQKNTVLFSLEQLEQTNY